MGSLAFVLGLVSLTTRGWWQSDDVSHGLWSAKINEEVHSIVIGSSEGYRGLETVRGLALVSILILASGLLNSLLSAIPQLSQELSPELAVWTHSAATLLISELDN